MRHNSTPDSKSMPSSTSPLQGPGRLIARGHNCVASQRHSGISSTFESLDSPDAFLFAMLRSNYSAGVLIFQQDEHDSCENYDGRVRCPYKHRTT